MGLQDKVRGKGEAEVELKVVLALALCDTQDSYVTGGASYSPMLAYNYD